MGNPPQDVLVDHRNGDSLDNRRANLRLCSYSQNTANSAIRRDNTSGRKGVSFQSGRKKPWIAKIQVEGRERYLGHYSTAEEAGEAYRIGAIEAFGEFARCA